MCVCLERKLNLFSEKGCPIHISAGYLLSCSGYCSGVSCTVHVCIYTVHDGCMYICMYVYTLYMYVCMFVHCTCTNVLVVSLPRPSPSY